LDKVGTLMSKTEQGEAAVLSQQITIDLNPWHGGAAEKEKLSILKKAVRELRLIHFSYTNSQGTDTDRDCEPLGIVMKRYIWYLHGYCRLRKELRIFRLSRIEHLRVLPEAFEQRLIPPEDMNLRWSRSNGPHGVRLVLQFQPKAKAKVQDYFSSEQIVTQPDGTLLVTAIQPEEPWLYDFLLSYGADVLIIEPGSIAQAVKKKAQEVFELYK
jgi:predicted DNA-binding transcriptional regulator YafY